MHSITLVKLSKKVHMPGKEPNNHNVNQLLQRIGAIGDYLQSRCFFYIKQAKYHPLLQ